MSNIIDYLPDFYAEIEDFQKLTATEGIELQALRGAIEQLLNDQFVLTSGVAAVKRREKMLGIQADPNIETLDFRRKRIINRYSTKPPFTPRWLQERLDYLVGAGRAKVTVDIQSFILTVIATLQDASVFREVERTIYAVKPANMIYQQQTAVSDVIVLEEHISRRNLIRGVRLGTTWQLGITPFATLDPEVVIK